MTDFKNQQELLAYLVVDGNKIILNSKSILFYVDGKLHKKDVAGKVTVEYICNFSFACDLWSKYIEPDWTDKLDGAVENARWCWVSDNTKYNNKELLVLIKYFYKDSNYPYKWNDVSYKYAIPVTNEELESMKSV